MIQRIRRSRLLGWDRNPLRRRSDRVEGAMLAGLIAAFLIFGLVLFSAAARGIEDRQRGGAPAWRQVTATVQRTAPNVPEKPDGFVWPLGTVRTPALWLAGGLPHSGWIPVRASTPAGRRVRIWVSHSGALTGAPPSRDRAEIAAIGLVCLFGLVLLGMAGAGRALLGRRRLADWDRAWLAAARRWSRKR